MKRNHDVDEGLHDQHLNGLNGAHKKRMRASYPSHDAQEKKKARLMAPENLQKIADAYKTILECCGEDVNREGLLRTPMRAAKAIAFCNVGSTKSIEEVLNDAIFEEDAHEMVLVRDIHISSLCEHHLIPFIGKVHIAYIPNGKVLGLSKFARIADVFARRFQVQERLTKQIADCLMTVLQPQGVAVAIEASHMCMVMRGVEKTTASTLTSCVLGCFRENKETRAEFFSLLQLGKR